MPVALLERRKANEFARALERPGDAADPTCERLLRVASELTLGPDAGPRPSERFRAQLRERLLAEATAPNGAPQDARRDHPADRADRVDPARHRATKPARWRRRLVVTGAGVALLGGSAAGVAAASQDALPGDALYPVKRLVERAELAAPGSKAERGQRYLDQAHTRLWEVQQTLARAGDRPLGPDSLAQVGSALDNMRESVAQGGALITSDFPSARGDASLRKLSGFITAQRTPVAALENQLPAPLAARPPGLLDLFNQLGEQVTQLSKGTIAAPYASSPPADAGSRDGAGRPGGAPRRDGRPGGAQAGPGQAANPSSGQGDGASPSPTGAPASPSKGPGHPHGPGGVHITVGHPPHGGGGPDSVELPPVLPGLPTIGIGIGDD